MDGRAGMAGAGTGAVWRGVAAEPPCVSGGGRSSAAWGGEWGGIPERISGGGVCLGGCRQWSAGHAM